MSSPTSIFNCLSNLGFRVLDWSGRRRVPKRDFDDVPRRPGVYALYFGRKLQYIGSTLRSLRGRMINHRNSQDNYKPHGLVSWFELPERQVREAEAVLIDSYEPPYSKRRPRINRRKRRQ